MVACLLFWAHALLCFLASRLTTVSLDCKKAISTYHDKHVFVTVESLMIIRHWTRVKNLLLYLKVVAFVYLSILINNPP